MFRSIQNIFSPKNKKINKIKNQFISGSAGFLDLSMISSGFNGDKVNFFNGFGLTADLRIIDLRLLQFRSLQLLRENSFANSIFGRLETKVINTGLRLRSTPPSEILSFFLTDNELQEWSGNTEKLFEVWSKDKRLVSFSGKYTFGQLQRIVYRTALLSGDCLIILSINKLGLPVIELVDGINIASPFISDSKNIVHGVELDTNGQEIAFHVIVDNYGNKFKRISAFTVKGQRRAWLVRATETRIDDIRGLPLLSVVMQNINEIGKYMDSEQRAALVNSYVAVVHNVSEKAPSNNPFSKAALNSDSVTNATTGDSADFKKMQPGFFATKLSAGETISSFDTKRPNVNFGPFVEFVIKTIAHALEIPPEVLLLEFDSNFSASRQAKLDFNDYVQKAISIFSESFCQPVYNEWLTGMILTNQINSPGYIDSLINLKDWAVLGAWRSAVWRGLPNKSVDELKQVKALEIISSMGWMTNTQIADEYFGTDYSDNVRKLLKEREANGIVKNNSNDIIEEMSNKLDDFITSFEVK